MTPNETKTLRQQAFQEKWIQNEGRGVFIACTGFGKTRVGLSIAKAATRTQKDRIIHIVVPSIPLKKSWEALVKEFEVINATVFVANTYIKERRSCTLLIVDEVHNFSNDKATAFRKVVAQTEYRFFLGLSATLSEDRVGYLASHNIPILDEVTLKEARKQKWVSDFVVLCIPTRLNDNDQEYYKKLHEDFNKYFAIFNHDFNLAMACMKAEPALEYSKQLSDEWDEKRVRVAAINWNRNMQKRKAFLYHADAKITMASKLITELKKHTIAFCQSTAGADTLQTYIGDGCSSYHSKKGVREKRIALEKFISKQDFCISTAEALDEGFDVEHIELGVVWARTSVPLQSVQRIGRTIRFIEGKKAFIIQIYVEGSQDENWLRKSLRGTPQVLWLKHPDQALEIINSHERDN